MPIGTGDEGGGAASHYAIEHKACQTDFGVRQLGGQCTRSYSVPRLGGRRTPGKGARFRVGEAGARASELVARCGRAEKDGANLPHGTSAPRRRGESVCVPANLGLLWNGTPLCWLGPPATRECSTMCVAESMGRLECMSRERFPRLTGSNEAAATLHAPPSSPLASPHPPAPSPTAQAWGEGEPPASQ